MSTSSWSLVSTPDTPSNSSVQQFTPTPSQDSYFVAVADREYDALENAGLSGYDSASYLSIGFDERSVCEKDGEAKAKEGGSVSASALEFQQGASILEMVSLAQHQNEFAAQARRVDEWLDNQPDQDYKAVDFAVATPVTPVASDAGDYEERSSLVYDEDEDVDADSESSSVSEVMSEDGSTVGVAVGREELDGGVAVELQVVRRDVSKETYQVAEVEDSSLQLSTAEVDSVVIKVNTAENAAKSHVHAEKDPDQQDAEVMDSSPTAAASSPEIPGDEEIHAAVSTASEQLDQSTPTATATSQQIYATNILGEAFPIPSSSPTEVPQHHRTAIIGAPSPAPPLILAARDRRSWLTILTTRRLPKEQPIFPRIWRTSLGVRRQPRYYTGVLSSYSNALRVEMDDVYGFGGVLTQFPVWPASRYTSGATLGTFGYI
ncbi:hypothetical protein L207DRAFT_538682 [Hyaloscypha variabilis F]|uniref:Uncharacterized protein n=1 Tax=Hyaloscypha variabilis (strain UAMH 11265 / GT02V1 / F) TaxID=1149755 RepID=A0A2J6QTZ5_HYAVF|nr:hypothetical protein L207DRAFT_538682 [Hyaloscypha variabilis F]